MRKIFFFCFIIVGFISCQQTPDKPVNLISPSGKLLAKNTQEIKRILAKTTNDVASPQDIHLTDIFYDEEDSVTVAKISYVYNGEKKEALFYLNRKDTNDNEMSLLENSKLVIILQPNQPAVIILTDKEENNVQNSDQLGGETKDFLKDE